MRLKKLFLLLWLWGFLGLATASVEINKATVADLDGVRGIGPSLSDRILQERQKTPFKDWADLIARVKGIGQGNATRFSSQGLRVNGQPYSSDGAPPAPPRTRPFPPKSEKASPAPRSASATQQEKGTLVPGRPHSTRVP